MLTHPLGSSPAQVWAGKIAGMLLLMVRCTVILLQKQTSTHFIHIEPISHRLHTAVTYHWCNYQIHQICTEIKCKKCPDCKWHILFSTDRRLFQLTNGGRAGGILSPYWGSSTFIFIAHSDYYKYFGYEHHYNYCIINQNHAFVDLCAFVDTVNAALVHHWLHLCLNVFPRILGKIYQISFHLYGIIGIAVTMVFGMATSVVTSEYELQLMYVRHIRHCFIIASN